MPEEDPWFGLGPGDVRVVVGTVHYYVKVVRRGSSLLPGAADDGGVAGLVLLGAATAAGWVDREVAGGAVTATVDRARDRASRSQLGSRVVRAAGRLQHARGWKIGVIRRAGDAWGPTGATDVAHVETASRGPFPAERVAELVELARSGHFSTGIRRWGRNPARATG